MLLDRIKKRSSVRAFEDRNIPDEAINYILEAGRLSPSGGNEQSWKFGVITKRELINEIAEIAYSQKWIGSAKLLIVICTVIVPHEEGGREIQKSRFPKYVSAIDNLNQEIYERLNQEEHQTKIPGTHMVLAALEQGIASTWISHFKVDELSQKLKLPKEFIPGEIIAFGYPKEKIKHATKKKLDDLLFFDYYKE